MVEALVWRGGLAVTLVLLLANALVLWNMSKHDYFVQAEPVRNQYDEAARRRLYSQQPPYQNGQYGNWQNPNQSGGWHNNQDMNQSGNWQNNQDMSNQTGDWQNNQNMSNQTGDWQNNQNMSNQTEDWQGNSDRSNQNGQPQADGPKIYENMGFQPEETPWHPEKESEKENKMTGFDQSYFKD